VTVYELDGKVTPAIRLLVVEEEETRVSPA
jgi:hypothetical protein